MGKGKGRGWWEWEWDWEMRAGRWWRAWEVRAGGGMQVARRYVGCVGWQVVRLRWEWG